MVCNTQDAEFRHQVRRLSHHPSIVIWDGCNECTVIIGTPTGIYATFGELLCAQNAFGSSVAANANPHAVRAASLGSAGCGGGGRHVSCDLAIVPVVRLEVWSEPLVVSARLPGSSVSLPPCDPM